MYHFWVPRQQPKHKINQLLHTIWKIFYLQKQNELNRKHWFSWLPVLFKTDFNYGRKHLSCKALTKISKFSQTNSRQFIIV